MNKQEHATSIQNLLKMVSAEHQADASEILTALSEAFEGVMDNLDAANANVTTLTANNEKLRRVNADLFLKVGSKPTPETKQESSEIPDLKFDDLFNEKGELK